MTITVAPEAMSITTAHADDAHGAHEESVTPPVDRQPRARSAAPQVLYIGGDAVLLAERDGPRGSGRKKHHWSPEEDDRLRALIAEHGPHKWSQIAHSLPGRLGKQCRERWHNHLSPDLQKAPWSAEEDQTILSAVRTFGTRWSEIVRLLPGRTDNAIKNRWNSSQRKLQRRAKKSGGAKADLVARKLDVCPAALGAGPRGGLSCCLPVAQLSAAASGLIREAAGGEGPCGGIERGPELAAGAPAAGDQQRHMEAALAITALAGHW